MSYGTVSKPAGIHERIARAERIERSSNRNFGFVFAAVFGLLGGLSAWYGGEWALWWLAAAGTFLGCALIAPRILQPLNVLWSELGLLLFRIISPLVLGMMYYFVFVPTGLLLRLSGKNLLNLRHDPNCETYWLPKDASTEHTMKNQF